MHTIIWILAMVLFIAGMVVMGYATEVPGMEFLLFGGGLVLLTVGFWIAIAFGRREQS